MVNYLETHDRQRVMRELGDRGIFDEAAFKRAKLGAVLLMTSMGVPMLWMGQEFGEYKRKSESVIQPKKIAWTLLEKDSNQDLFEAYKHLIALRKKSIAIQSDNIEFFHENPDSKVLAYLRWHGEDKRVVIVANFSDQYLAGYRVPNFSASGTWRELMGSEVVADDGLTIDLPEYEAKVFVYQ